MTRKQLTMVVSSLTGNTRAIANGVRAALESDGWEIQDFEKCGKPADLIALCFWCRKSTLDDASRAVLSELESRQIICFGTCGGYPDGGYGDRVRSNVTAEVSARNTCLGVFLSQGKVPLQRIEKRKQLPLDHPHHLDEAGIARLMESLKHPNADDIARAVAFAREKLAIVE